MTLHSIIEKLRRLAGVGRKPSGHEPGEGPATEPAEAEGNPFPEPVVIPFSDVIDLHSIPPRLIRAVVEDYLDEANRRGVRWLRIIHGKGIGVQRENVRKILERSPYVAAFRPAPPEAGGAGATLVELKVQLNAELKKPLSAP